MLFVFIFNVKNILVFYVLTLMTGWVISILFMLSHWKNGFIDVSKNLATYTDLKITLLNNKNKKFRITMSNAAKHIDVLVNSFLIIILII